MSIRISSSNNRANHLTNPKYRPDIDGLRALAVLSVVVFHAFPNWGKGGFIGVDIFFVISGFLISTVMFGSLESSNFSFIEFYSRRIKRIFPALFVVLLAAYAFGWFALLSDEFKQLGKHIAGGSGFISNFLFWQESGYFDNVAETKPLLHLWSLGVEEQFYIIWPLFLWLAWKRKLNLLTIAIAIGLVSFSLNAFNIGRDTISTFYSPQTRFWELMTGSVLAYITLHKDTTFTRLGHALDNWLGRIIYAQAPEATGKTLQNVQSILGVSLIFSGIYLISKDTAFPGTWAILPTLGAVLVIAAGTEAWLNRAIFSHPIFVWFGLISYPLYLWHWPLLSFARIIQHETPSRTIRIVAVMIAIVLSWLTYKIIERPVRFGKHGVGIVFALVLSMTSIGCAGYYSYKNNGLSFRVTKYENLASVFAKFPHEPFHNQECDSLFPLFKEFDACLLSKSKMPEVVIIGDSHSNHYYRSLAKELADYSVMNIAQWSCLPFSSQTHQYQNKCNEKLNLAMSFLRDQKSIKTVYLAGYWSYLASGGFEISARGARQAKPLTPSESLSFVKNGEFLIANLVASGKDVVMLRDIPDLDFNVMTCFDLRPLRITNQAVRSPCAMERHEYDLRISTYNSTLSLLTNKFPTLKIFDPVPMLCDSKLCWATKNGEPVYFNTDHLTINGSNLIVKDLASKFPILR